jgi:L-threonylcarbamoyladenylate synthase
MLIDIEQAITQLEQEQIVAVPTETVYGLAAKFDSEKAIQKVFTTKQRPLDHPLIVHIADINDLKKLTTNLPSYAEKLTTTLWPGPLTLIAKKSALVSNAITAEQNTVAIRMPDHPITHTIITRLNSPIVAPSANRFCQTSPTTAQHVLKSLGDDIAVVDGGKCNIGIESTIIDITQADHITLLRPGMITAENIEQLAGVPCHNYYDTQQRKFPGSHKTHYAPSKPIQIINSLQELNQYYKNIYYMLLNKPNTDKQNIHIMPNNAADYATELYQHWHSASQQKNIEKIIIELPPQHAQWLGIMDRIFKAAN